MKKLKLKLDGKEMLSKDQMKKIAGGYDCVAYGAWCQLPYPGNGWVFIEMDSCDTASGSDACMNNYYPAGFMGCGCWYA